MTSSAASEQDRLVTIAPVVDLQGCRHVQAVHQRIWLSGPEDLVPLHVLITMVKNGGLLLGAYTADGPPETGRMVGFVFGWLGAVSGATGEPILKHCSHIAGVLPEFQGRGVGLRLKLAQREALLAQGLTDWATWTYDPLYRRNALFNIRRLGATSRTYLRDVYGEMNDALNAGVPSDRLQVDWHLRSERVLRAVAGTPAPAVDTAPLQVLPSDRTAAGLLKPGSAQFAIDGRALAVPIPDDVTALRGADRELLLEWRLYLRAVFERAFAAGYLLVDCRELPAGWHYLLDPRALT